ncbi:hypothetical protein BBJ28_00013745 [Nothophytophthora sp. Chile5]|nr:hypothetical protein BBJ28_00013745 [Nothophytophthora sp. Chile5]
MALEQLSAVHSFIESTPVGGVNLLVGAGLLAVMYPPLANVPWNLLTPMSASLRGESAMSGAGHELLHADDIDGSAAAYEASVDGEASGKDSKG